MKIDFKKKASEIVGHLGDNRPADQIVYLYFAEKVLKEVYNEGVEKSAEISDKGTNPTVISDEIRELKEK